MSAKICFVRRGYSASGGAEAYLRRLAAALVDQGAQPGLITSADWPAEAWAFGPITRIGARSPIGFARESKCHFSGAGVIFSLERVPGCHIFRAGDGVHAAWLERRQAFEPTLKKWVHRMNPKHRQLLALERSVFSPGGAQRVIVNSRMVKAEIEHWFSYPDNQIRLVYNGYTPKQSSAGISRESARSQLHLPVESPVGLFVGSGWERKGLDLALELPRKIPGCRLLVAGRGKERAQLENVHYVGATNDLTNLFAAADFFVLPTYYDPFSNACLEALSAGLPVFTTRANGFSEIIDPGIHGEIIHPGDRVGLVQSLQLWIKRGWLQKQREACRCRAIEHTMERNVKETLAVIVDCL